MKCWLGETKITKILKCWLGETKKGKKKVNF